VCGAASSSSKGGGGGGADSASLAAMMRVALDAGVAQLVEMGYSRSKAEDALRECACDVEAAVEFLTAACC
jgi:Holliday junction resolvasome RuvABC DNA-binding subunit